MKEFQLRRVSTSFRGNRCYLTGELHSCIFVINAGSSLENLPVNFQIIMNNEKNGRWRRKNLYINIYRSSNLTQYLR
jgi:hypothetical protein